MTFGRVLGLIAVVAAVAYPVLVYVGLTRWSSRLVAVVIIAMAAVTVTGRLARSDKREELRGVLVVPLSVVTLAVLSAVLDSQLFLLLTPVLISVALLVTFGTTLRDGATPMIERFARLQDANLTADKVRWCRTTTLVWCGFFVANGVTAAILATWAPLSWWALYTGLGAYLIMGALFAGEFVLRKLRFETGNGA